MATMTMKEKQEKAIAAFEMPAVSVGDIVIWHSAGRIGRDVPYPAVVVKVGARHIELHIHVSNQLGNVIKNRVRHIADPIMTEYESDNEGGWEHTAATKSNAKLAVRFEAMENRLTEIEKALRFLAGMKKVREAREEAKEETKVPEASPAPPEAAPVS